MTDELGDVAAQLRRVREEVRRRALVDGRGTTELPPPPPAREPQPPPREVDAEPEPLPPLPDAAAVNESWRAEPGPPSGGLVGWARRIGERLLGPRFEAQRAFNARQVQLDNAILRYLDDRFAATHRHYDRVLGQYGRHLGEILERHMILQEELVLHVQDLMRRIDLVLAESDRGRLALEFALEDLRARLARLEEALRRG